jgi:hypothetical protein
MGRKRIRPAKMFVCYECRAPMRMTAPVDFVIRADGTMLLENVAITHARWYCENGHEATDCQWKQLRRHFVGLDIYHRLPGVTLDIEVFPHVKAKTAKEASRGPRRVAVRGGVPR